MTARTTQAKLTRVWHPYTSWEEFPAGMWSRIHGEERAELLRQAIEFTGDHILYGSWMLKVAEQWPISCEHNLTGTGINRRAWTGHAACCLAIGCPEDITREAWGHLTQQQQDDANRAADRAIHAWEQAYEGQDTSVHQNLGWAWVP